MSMLQHSTRAWGSPSRYIQGRYELENMKTHTEVYGRRVFFLIDVFFFADYKKRFEALYAGSDSQIQCEQFGGQCTEEEILRCTGLAKALNPDVVVGIGGGKTMDTRRYKKNPALVLLDTDILAKAPIRFLVAGMGDALSTYPECRANVQSASPNYVNSGYHQTIACIAVSKACHETILTKGVSAKLAAEQGLCTKDVEDVIEANTLLSGLGVQNGSCAGAHSIAEGITVLEPCAKLLHGEVVAFGILVQLIVEGAPAEELDELYTFFEEVGLPTTFDDLGIPDATEADIRKVAETSMHSYWDVEPFAVNPQMVFDGIMMANTLGKRRKGL